MKIIIIAAFFTLSLSAAFCQINIVNHWPTGYYGPVQYRTPEQTIGEYYIVLPLDESEKTYGYLTLKSQKNPDENLKDSTLKGTPLKLISIDNNEKKLGILKIKMV